LAVSSPPRSLWLSGILIALTIALGLAVRFVPFGQPQGIAKYGGSALWALMIYWLTTALAPRLRVMHAALIAIAIATAVEFFKLVHTPAVDSFRGTIAGILLLGRFFSYFDILAYCAAITCGAWADEKLRAASWSRPI
jgi:Protein of unknown function (DUF2809)